MKKQRFFTIGFFLVVILTFFSPFFLMGKLPVPADTIIGLYHPYRDLYANDYPNGIPYKNFLITDPVRQQYPWRWLAVEQLKQFQLPTWNPYTLAGGPLIATFQSGVFYPLNIVYFILPFQIAWSLLIIVQPLLAGLFLYLYLRKLQINPWACLLSAITFAFSGFATAWLEWNTVLHTGLWLPLILLSIDRVFFNFGKESSKLKVQNSKLQIKIKNYLWTAAFVTSLTASFFAGHLQTFFYVFLVQLAYFLGRWFQFGKKVHALMLLVISYLLFVVITSVQFIPTVQFIMHSAREVDLTWQKEGWFIPWQHLVQFIAPDFFGNPSTLNYWGVWNYGEFVGYVGILPLIMALYCLFFRYDKKVVFFGCLFFLSLLFSFPTVFAKIPYGLNIPFLSTAQPTRLLFVTDFSLAILAGLGFDYFLQKKNKILYPVLGVALLFGLIWIFVSWFGSTMQIRPEDIEVAKRNLYFPTAILGVAGCILIITKWVPKKFLIFITLSTLIITAADLLRFSNKFTTFTNGEYLYPSTKITMFLQQQEGQFRIMATDPRILPPNFSIMYGIQTVNGYDPLYLRRYGELIAASERGEPDISPPFGFNRIIAPQKYDSKIIDLLGVRYVLSLSDITSPKLKKVFQEGQTQVYENIDVLPRAFFVQELVPAGSKEAAIGLLFENSGRFTSKAVVESYLSDKQAREYAFSEGSAVITEYVPQRVVIKTVNEESGFLVLTDSYYPTWRATIDGEETRIFRTNYTFRGVVVPRGQHIVTFYNTLF